MLRYINKKIRNRKGFSLIELIVVVGILGILAMVAIPRVTTSLVKARETTDLANLRTLNNAVELYYAEKGTYPVITAENTFEKIIVEYLPSGVPEPQVTTMDFWYYGDANPGLKVMYQATNTDCATNSQDTDDAGTNWTQISN